MSAMIKIGLDALGIGIEGGARTSVIRMIRFITQARPQWRFILYLSQREPQLEAPNVKQVILPASRGILSRLFVQIYLPFDVLLRGVQLVHFTKSQASLVPFAKKVFTIHDVTTLKHPEIHAVSAVLYWKHVQPFMAKRMDAVFTVSNDAAKDLVEVMHVAKEKVFVIYNASQFESTEEHDAEFERTVMEKYDLPEDYFLYVGILALKKNLDTLIEACRLLKSRGETLPPLFLVGPRYSISDAGDVLDMIKASGLEDRIHYLGRIPKKELYYIFRNASIFLFPSYHEGFGIPCLEAMQFGVPLIATRTSAIPEIVGEAGILIEDYMSPETWADKIKELHHDPEKKKRLSEASLKRYEKITSEHSFSAVLDVYERLLKIEEHG